MSPREGEPLLLAKQFSVDEQSVASENNNKNNQQASVVISATATAMHPTLPAVEDTHV